MNKKHKIHGVYNVFRVVKKFLWYPTAYQVPRTDVSLLLIETYRNTPQYTKQSPSPESNSLSGGQKFFPFLEKKVPLHFKKFRDVLNQFYTVYTRTIKPYFV
jgi:hypothetical protein